MGVRGVPPQICGGPKNALTVGHWCLGRNMQHRRGLVANLQRATRSVIWWSGLSPSSQSDSKFHISAYCFCTSHLSGRSVCGDYIVEWKKGEQCDPPNVGCCNSKCLFKPKGTVCRTARHQCDVPDRCTGDTARCPADRTKTNGYACNTGRGLDKGDCCIDGVCSKGACPPRIFLPQYATLLYSQLFIILSLISLYSLSDALCPA